MLEAGLGVSAMGEDGGQAGTSSCKINKAWDSMETVVNTCCVSEVAKRVDLKRSYHKKKKFRNCVGTEANDLLQSIQVPAMTCA